MNNGKDSGQLHNTYSLWQQMTLVTSTLIGVSVLTLPRDASAKLHEAGWIAPLLGSLLAMIAMWLIARLSCRFPGLTFIQYSPIIWGSPKRPWQGKWLSVPWVLAYLLLLYLSTAVNSRIFGEVVVTAVLLQTPLEVVIITMFVLAFILCQHEEEVVARTNELLFLLILFPLLFIAFASFQKAKVDNLFPLLRVSWDQLLPGTLDVSFSLQGYEIMLIFFAFANRNVGKVKAGLYGIGMVSIVYTLIVISGISVFGYEELQRQTWPTLELVKTTKVPGLILERLESAFLGVWVAAVFTTVANIYYAFIYGLRQLLGRGTAFQRSASFILLIPLFFISLWPQNILESFRVMNLVGRFGLLFSIGAPLVHWLVLLAREKVENRRDAGA